jgi:putative FmdB family regulatory protein
MPLFEYRCSPCSRDFELLIRAKEEARCPQCGTRSVEKLFSESAPPSAQSSQSLPISSACPPGDAPCSPHCCRL